MIKYTILIFQLYRVHIDTFFNSLPKGRTEFRIPFLIWFANKGISLGISSADYGFAMADTMYPAYSLGLIAGTTILVLVATTIVSYWPSRKIAKMNPTEALRGKLQ